MTGQKPIVWHLDPTVWQRAIHGRHEALLWWTGPGTRTGWCVYLLGALDPLDQGTAADETDGKARAEAAMLAREVGKPVPADNPGQLS